MFEPSEDGTWRLIWQPAHYEAIGIEPITIGWYGGHALLIKDTKKVANIYACAHCNKQFTKASNLHRHADHCTSGKTEVICPGTVVERPQSAYEKVFYPKTNASKGLIDWLEYEAEKRNLHIHHALCGYGDERWIAEAPVDGYEPSTKTVFNITAVTFMAFLPTVSKTTPVSYSRKLDSRKRKLRMQATTWSLSGNVKLLATNI